MLPRLVILTILVLSAVVGLSLVTPGRAIPAAAAVSPPPQPAVAVVPRVRFLGVSTTRPPRGQVHLQFQVENLAPVPLPYAGYRPGPQDRPGAGGSIAPLYSLQFERKGGWKPSRLGWCGTGTGPVRLEPQSKATFLLSVPLDDWKAMKAGLTWYPTEERQDPQVAWSDAVPRKRVAPRQTTRSAGRT